MAAKANPSTSVVVPQIKGGVFLVLYTVRTLYLSTQKRVLLLAWCRRSGPIKGIGYYKESAFSTVYSYTSTNYCQFSNKIISKSTPHTIAQISVCGARYIILDSILKYFTRGSMYDVDLPIPNREIFRQSIAYQDGVA